MTLVDEEHRAGGHGGEGARRARRTRARRASATCRTRSSSRRARPSATSRSPDRVVVGAFDEEDGDGVAALYEPLDAPVVRTDVASAEMIKLASNAFLATKVSLHQRDRERLRGDGRRRRPGRGGDGARSAGSARTSCAPGSAIGELPAEGRRGAQAAGRELGLPLPAPDGGDRGQRAPEAARGRQADRSTSGRCAARRSRCSGSPSSRTRTTCARRRASCSRRGCWPRARTSAGGIPWRIDEARQADRAASSCSTTCSRRSTGADAAVDRDRVGRAAALPDDGGPCA